MHTHEPTTEPQPSPTQQPPTGVDDTARSQAALDADDLAQHLAFLTSALTHTVLDQGRDYAEHMLDPSASSDDFHNELDAYRTHLGHEIHRVRTELDDHLNTHRRALATDPVWGTLTTQLRHVTDSNATATGPTTAAAPTQVTDAILACLPNANATPPTTTHSPRPLHNQVMRGEELGI